MEPGDSVALAGEVDVPQTPGRYRLRWDLVCEGVTWFSERGTPTADQTVDVVPSVAAAQAPDPTTHSGRLEDWMVPSLPSRTELWRAAIELWRRHPWLGVGPDVFRLVYPTVLEPPPGPGRFADTRLHANSLYFETLADLGGIGIFALAALIVAVASVLRRHVRRRDATGVALTIAAVTFFVHGLLDTFFAFTPLGGLFWLLWGSSAALAKTTPPGASQDNPP